METARSNQNVRQASPTTLPCVDAVAAPQVVALHEVFERAAARWPDRVAVDVPPSSSSVGRRTWTYAEIDAMANRLARRLAPWVRQEAVIAVALPRRSCHLYVAQLAVLKAGAGYASIDPALPADRIRFIIEDSGAVAVLTGAETLGVLDGLEVERAGRVLDVQEWGDSCEQTTPLSDAWKMPPRQVGGNDLCYVIYTSGTTGSPKGVMIEHRSIVNLVNSNETYFDLGPDDRVAQASSPAFDVSVEETWLAFAAGATLVVLDDEVSRSGPDLVPWMRDEHITVLSPTPTLLRMCASDDPLRDLPDLRLVYVGGEALPPDVAAKWAPGRWLENAYGPTECTVTVVRCPVHSAEAITIGLPVDGNFAHVLDESLSDVPDGEVGELCIGGAGVARGYLNRPELTAQKFVEHPLYGRLYRTGDQVLRLPSGELEYHGRIDGQVKVRGYRVELEDIEAHIAHCDGVRMGACKVQGAGANQELVAFVVLDEGRQLEPEALREELGNRLPAYMVPSRFAPFPHLPTGCSGKLDRRSLPDVEVEIVREGEVVAPRTAAERRIADVFAARLPGAPELCVHDDFFDLGGTSVTAAEAISDLRRTPGTDSLTVRDLYSAPSVAGLAGRLGASPVEAARPRQHLGYGWPKLVTASQLSVLFGGLMVGSSLGYLLAFQFMPYLVENLGLIPFLLLSPLIGLALLVVYLPVSLGIAVGAKKLLIGRYKPGRYPAWSGMFFRNWLVQSFAGVLPWGLVKGTVFQNMLLRALGAKIGKNVHIHTGVDLHAGGWDLLEIGDNATLLRDCGIRVVDFQDQELIFAPVTIGANCTLETRALLSPNARMEPGGYLTALSQVPSGVTVPAGEMWEGVPARSIGPAPEIRECGQAPWSEHKHGTISILFGMAMTLLTSIPTLLLTLGLLLYFQLDGATVLAWLFSPTFGASEVAILAAMAVGVYVMTVFFQAFELRILGRIPLGTFSRWRLTYIRMKMKMGILESVGKSLSATLFWPWWLRLAGMRIGRDSEISTIMEVVPEHHSIGPETFFADGIYLGPPEIHRGVVRCAETTFGTHVFLGNHAVIPTGSHLPDDVLVGVSTVARADQIKKGSSWFGHPAFRLPRREVVDADRSQTHNPPWWRYLQRMGWEGMRFFFPIIPLGLMLSWFKTLPLAGEAVETWAFYALVLPLYSVAMSVLVVALVWAAKWALLGRVKPGNHPLWSSFVCRWDFIFVFWSVFARPLMAVFHGCLALSWWLRAMGSSVGKRVLLAGGFSQVVDPDMLHIEDDATVVTFFQAHTFEDRVLKHGHVRIGKQATTGAASVILYGADIGDGAHVSEQSVVMKHEVLQPGRYYTGSPTAEAERPRLD